jgi:hypothetical protein
VAALAVATARWDIVPTDPHDLLGAYQFLPPYATDHTEGQIFVLLESEPGPAVADEAGVFVAVPWTVGCGCAEEGWDQPAWVTPGDTVAFLLTETRRRVPWDGPPVYDVQGWHQPYPTGDFIRYWSRKPLGSQRWLSPREFFEVLQVLPMETTFRLDPESAFEGLLSLLAERQMLREAFPVSTILSEWETATSRSSSATPGVPPSSRR